MKIQTATLMATYRADDAKALAAALDSVLNQRLAEGVTSRIYLAIDGPIGDALESVIEERRQHLHRVLRLPVNRGLASALNSLIAALEGEEFVFRMDADDRSDLDRYQAQLDYLLQHPEVDILGTDILEVDGASGKTRRVSFARDHAHALRALPWRVPVAHPTVCFRRRVLATVQGYPTSGTNEDIGLWFKCAMAGFHFANLNEPLLQFNIGPNFWQRRSVKKAFSELRCYVEGIWRMDGMTWKFVFPVARFLLRLAPVSIARWAYASAWRRSH